MHALIPLLCALSAVPPGQKEAQFPTVVRREESGSLAPNSPASTHGPVEAFPRALAGGLAGSVGGGFLGYWSSRGLHSPTAPGTGALVGTASGMVVGSALGAWSKSGTGTPLPPLLGATVGGALGVGAWGLAALPSDRNSALSWEEALLLIGAPWIGSALGADIGQDLSRRGSVSVAPWIPEAGGAGLLVALRY